MDARSSIVDPFPGIHIRNHQDYLRMGNQSFQGGRRDRVGNGRDGRKESFPRTAGSTKAIGAMAGGGTTSRTRSRVLRQNRRRKSRAFARFVPLVPLTPREVAMVVAAIERRPRS